ncbi:MAG: hypothetical protein KDA41_18350, partial [Planctomycetales bacterium]|nr:hypothetical protein [Planctomycetales bacterium]
MQRAACRRQGGLIACAVALLSTAAVVGCSKSVAPPRSSDEIFQEQLSLPALYITESGKQITAPRGDGAFVDKST